MKPCTSRISAYRRIAASRLRALLRVFAILFLLLVLLVVPIAAQPLAGDLPPLPPSCVFPATCYVDQASSDVTDGSESGPFINFTEGMALAREWGLRRDAAGQVIVMPGHYAATGVYTYPTTITAPHGDVLLGAFPNMAGDTTCAWGSPDCNRCVPDVVAAFNRLRSHGDILGFGMGDQPPPRWGPGSLFAKHWQGMTRLAAGNGQTLIMAQDDMVIDGEGWSGFVTVKMGTRDVTGMRYRANRLSPSFPFEFTSPPAADIAVATTLLHPDYEHPGSPQALGSLMVIGADREVYLYDLSRPAQPQRLGPPDPSANGGIGPIIDRPGRSASSAAMAKLADGRYLIVVASSDARPLDFYVSHAPGDLRHYSNFDRWWPHELVDMPDQEYAWDTFQAINLVSECGTGKLYLIAAGNLDPTSSTWSDVLGGCLFGLPCYPDGEDWASLYEIAIADSIDIRLTKRAEFHAYCTLSSEHHCNFDASSGIYVDPDGHLILYAAEHDNDGPIPLGWDEGSVKFMEFREMPHGFCNTLADAWVELFEHDHFRGQGRMIDYRDRNQENYADYHQVGLEYFGDKASSARWCIPGGWGYRLYEHSNYGGDTLLITGTGEYRQIADLADYGFGDRISSSAWVDLSHQAAMIDGEVTIE